MILDIKGTYKILKVYKLGATKFYYQIVDHISKFIYNLSSCKLLCLLAKGLIEIN